MAIYYLHTKSISRAAGRSATAAAAYRAGERIRDERTGVLHNHSRRQDVNHAEILLPSRFSASEAHWARDRSVLWNAAEAAEHRRDSRVAREIQVSLPVELSPTQRLELARAFAQELADRHNVAIDLTIHGPRPDGDVRNHHAHLLATSREVHETGFGAKAGLDLSYSEQIKRGLCQGRVELIAIRERWATLTNEAFRTAGIDEHVDHRSLRAMGVNREPIPHIPYFAYKLERRGMRSDVARHIRENYRSRVAARAALSQSTESVGAGISRPASSPVDIEEMRRRSRTAWLKLRGQALQGNAEHSAATSQDRTSNQTPAQPISAQDLATDSDPEFGL
jgi:hypothetical protein